MDDVPYESIVEDSNDGILVAQTGEIVYANERLQELTGYAEATLIGAPKTIFVSDDDSALVEQYHSARMSGKDAPDQYEVTLESKSGDRIPIEFSVNQTSYDGEPTVIVVCRDVTERKQRQQQLEEERDLFAEGPAVVFKWENAEGWPVEYVSDNIVEMFGYTPEQLRSGEIPYSDLVHPDDLDRVASEVDQHSDATTERFSHEPYRMITSDGETKWVRDNTKITRDDGEITYYYGYLTDITAQKEREEEIQKLKNRLELAVKGTGLGVWDWDMRTDHVEFNEEWAAMLGHSLDEIEPHLEEWEKRVHPDDIDAVEAALNDHIAGKADLYDTEHRMATADGDWKWIRDIGQVVEQDAEGEPLRAVGIHQDITARKEREQKVEEQRNQLDVLNQVLRHDIRNDLQLVTAYADFLEDELDENIEYVETIQENAKHAVELTTIAREMADVWLSESDAQSQILLGQTLEQVLDEARTGYTESVIRVNGEIPDVPVLADDMLPSVFDNLLKNAIQHNDKEIPTVNVSAEDGAETIQVRIADNGPGVPDTRKESIFGKGKKGMESSGTGLGLHLVSTLMNNYGGSVWVQDNEPKGAVFAVELQKSAQGN